MSTVRITELISVEDYLEREIESPAKHEYVAGAVFAMVGAKNSHNRIAGNAYGLLYTVLKDKPCQPCNSDTKIRVRNTDHVRFYYPDVSVVCDENSPSDSFQDRPVFIIEVLSKSTRRLDDGEKRDAYFTIPTLSHYLLLEQDAAVAVMYERNGGRFERHEFTSLDDVIPITSLSISLALRDLYRSVVSG